MTRKFKVSNKNIEPEGRLITKKIKIVCKSARSATRGKGGEELWNWRIDVLAELNQHEFESAPPYIEKVQFNLHPTFENPIRVKTEPPFFIEEQGWGGFDMEIIAYFKNNLYEPYKYLYIFEHNVNSEVMDTMIFMNPVEELELLLRGQKDLERISNKTLPTIVAPEPVTSPKSKAVKSAKKRKVQSAEPEAQPEKSEPSTTFGKKSKNSSENSSRAQSPVSSSRSSTPSVDKKISEELWNKTPEARAKSLRVLQKKLSELETNRVVEVIKMVYTQKLDTSWIKTDKEDEFSFDINTLGDKLITELLKFVQQLE